MGDLLASDLMSMIQLDTLITSVKMWLMIMVMMMVVVIVMVEMMVFVIYHNWC